MKRIIKDFIKTQALFNQFYLHNQYILNNSFADNYFLESQKLHNLFSCNKLYESLALTSLRNHFYCSELMKAAQLSASIANQFTDVQENFSNTAKLHKQILTAQKLANFSAMHFKDSNVLFETLNYNLTNDYLNASQFESIRLKKYFESIFPAITLITIPYHCSDKIKVFEAPTSKGKHFTINCSESLEITEENTTINTLQKSLESLDQTLPSLYLANFSREEIIAIIGIIVTIISTLINHQDANRAHEDAVQAHLDFLTQTTTSQVQIEQGKRIIELLEAKQSINITTLEELRELRKEHHLQIKSNISSNEKRHD